MAYIWSWLTSISQPSRENTYTTNYNRTYWTRYRICSCINILFLILNINHPQKSHRKLFWNVQTSVFRITLFPSSTVFLLQKSEKMMQLFIKKSSYFRWEYENQNDTASVGEGWVEEEGWLWKKGNPPVSPLPSWGCTWKSQRWGMARISGVAQCPPLNIVAENISQRPKRLLKSHVSLPSIST